MHRLAAIILAQQDLVSLERGSRGSRGHRRAISAISCRTPAPWSFSRTISAFSLSGRQCILNRGRAFTDAQKGMIVLRITHTYAVVYGDVQLVQCCLESRRLVDAAGQHHDRALVEDHLKLQTEVTDGLEHDVSRGASQVATMQRPAETSFHASPPQLLDEARRRRLTAAPALPASRADRSARRSPPRPARTDPGAGRPSAGRRSRVP